MPYVNRGSIGVDRKTFEKLDKYRGDNESWNDLLVWLYRLMRLELKYGYYRRRKLIK